MPCAPNNCSPARISASRVRRLEAEPSPRLLLAVVTDVPRMSRVRYSHQTIPNKFVCQPRARQSTCGCPQGQPQSGGRPVKNRRSACGENRITAIVVLLWQGLETNRRIGLSQAGSGRHRHARWRPAREVWEDSPSDACRPRTVWRLLAAAFNSCCRLYRNNQAGAAAVTGGCGLRNKANALATKKPNTRNISRLYSRGLTQISGYRPQREKASIGSQRMPPVGIA